AADHRRLIPTFASQWSGISLDGGLSYSRRARRDRGAARYQPQAPGGRYATDVTLVLTRGRARVPKLKSSVTASSASSRSERIGTFPGSRRGGAWEGAPPGSAPRPCPSLCGTLSSGAG